jgi:gamma-tubulin complex component 3
MKHNLVNKLEGALRATSASLLPGMEPEDVAEITRALDVYVFEESYGDLGWDIFSLDYRVDGPLSAIFTAEANVQYLQGSCAFVSTERAVLLLLLCMHIHAIFFPADI